MNERVEYEMTQEQYNKLLEACRPVPMIMLQCGTPSSPQENANRAWALLGEEMGFEFMTVKSVPNKERFFTAVPKHKDK
jgi:uncharacterized membrane protein YjjP (DUF1212 family)